MINQIKKKIKANFIENNTIPDVEQSLRRIKNLGINPENVFDVGAYEGDFAKQILNIWPQTSVFCFEGNPEKKQIIETNLKKYNLRAKVFPILLGERNENEVKFNVSETASSVLDEFNDPGFKKVAVAMYRLDKLIEDKILPIPEFLKLDTQGYEYEILQGLGKYLNNVEYILLESNFIDIHKNVHLIADIVKLLDLAGFVMYDITEIHRRPLDQAIFQVDYIFIKEQSFLRQNKNWK